MPSTNNKKGSSPKEKTSSAKENKLGVKNSLVNNINARKEKGVSRSKQKTAISKKAYGDMENNWGKTKK